MKPRISQEYFDQILDYDPQTGFLKWKCEKGNRHAGQFAGHCGIRNVCTVMIDKTAYCIHRVVWERYKGPIPRGYFIDHINGNQHDNRLINLRCVLPIINSRNQGRKKNNTSGHTGVWWDAEKKKWAVEMMVNRKKVFIGRYADIEQAALARRAAQVPFGFHENHGQRPTKAALLASLTPTTRS